MRLVGPCLENTREAYWWLLENAEGWFARSLGIDPTNYNAFYEWASHHEWLEGDAVLVFIEQRGHVALLHPAIAPRRAKGAHDDFAQVEALLALKGTRRMEIGVRIEAGRSIRRLLHQEGFCLEGIKRGALLESVPGLGHKVLRDLEIWSKLIGEGA